jgi:hypothetical protein
LCHGTRLGCSTCDIVVCDFHWPYEFTHNRADYGLLGHRWNTSQYSCYFFSFCRLQL